MFFCVAALPDGLPVGPVVVPSIEPLEVEPVAAGPPEVELPPAEFCASANVLVRTNAVASAIVLYFMAVSSRFMDRSNRHNCRMFLAHPQRDRATLTWIVPASSGLDAPYFRRTASCWRCLVARASPTPPAKDAPFGGAALL